MDHTEILDKLERVCAPVLDQLGYRLIEREYVNERGRWIIRLYIDREGGVNIDDCERVSHALEDLIEVEMEFGHPYSLEVSSPGIYRPLRKPEDFSRFKGANVRVKTRYPLNGRRNYRGVIEDVTNDAVAMVVDGMRYTIPFEALAKARLDEDVTELSAKGREQG